ncbi:hypothetical protein IM660_14315 [Ruania alkalisoli]|uniref:Ig-like domain-containing protein n=1 Tax=Ruania alkalisoli TaxID=2779775 RepID=A0A7M1SQV2_9MICO|nr:hypothetical protein [Ruania alkalisoli]QOR69821.1 hypothetical protein IM660_14315 [Ruania alkalisoli]
MTKHRGFHTACASIAVLTAGLVAATPSDAHAGTTAIPPGTTLVVQDETTTSSASLVTLATHVVTTSYTDEVRRIATSLPVSHSRSGSINTPDRFYFYTRVGCTSPVTGSSAIQITNILADESATLAPNLLVTFPDPGTYSCALTYKIVTGGTYDNGTDDMVVGTGGAVIADTPVTSTWATQCNWAAPYSTDPTACTYTSANEEEAIAIEFSQTSPARTPVETTIPAGTTASVRAAASLTGCGGSGGGSDMLLCGDTHESWRPSGARSNIEVIPVDSTDPTCAPTYSTNSPEDGVAYASIPLKVHHSPINNALTFTTSSTAGCPTEYRIAQHITTTSGETIVMHQNGSLLYVY